MWHIEACDIREAKLESGTDLLGSIPTLAVFDGETCLINAATVCDFTADPCQLLICDCGIVGCASGGYVSFRRIGTSLAMLPVLRTLTSDRDFDRLDLAPPAYFKQHDALCAVFSPVAYSAIKSRIPEFPTVSEVAPLTSSEAIAILQTHAPLQVLGRFPETPRLKRDTILAVTDGCTDTETQLVQSFIDACIQDESPLATGDANDHWTPIEFHLDGPGFPAWQSFVKSKGRVAFWFPPAGVLVPCT